MSEHRIGRVEEIPERQVTMVEIDGIEVGIIKILGQFRAYENRCPHQYGPVCLGEVLGQQEAVLDEKRQVVGERFSDQRFNLVCPWHGWSYDVLTGENIGDHRFRLRPWTVFERDGEVFVQPPSPRG